MAFLDNSGDIILDAVLTDLGRKRLAQGDGSFKISKFALGDDEIDYGLYNNLDPRGSAYYDLEILQTPVFEAFTNNISSLNSKLITIPRNNILYLPVMKLNGILPVNNVSPITEVVRNGYIITADEKTSNFILNTSNKPKYNGTAINQTGIMNGFATGAPRSFIRIDQGIDNIAQPADGQFDSDLLETQYTIEVDSRILTIVSSQGVAANYSYIDDDYIATYYMSMGNATFVTMNASTEASNQVIAGRRGTMLQFSLRAASDINYGTFLFDTIGKDITSKITTHTNASVNSFKSIQTSVRVTGLTTGYSLEVPIVVFKYIS